MSCTIVSVYPMELKAEFKWSPTRGAGSHTYKIPAAIANGFQLLEVEDAYQQYYAGESIGYRWDIVPAQKIAENLIFVFVSGRVGQQEGHRPGIWITGEPAAFNSRKLNEAAQAESDLNRAAQESYFDYLIQEGQALFIEGKYSEITGDHRAAAIWMGKQDLDWLRPLKQLVKKECPLCLTDIPMKALVCPNCRHTISKLPKEFEELNK